MVANREELTGHIEQSNLLLKGIDNFALPCGYVRHAGDLTIQFSWFFHVSFAGNIVLFHLAPKGRTPNPKQLRNEFVVPIVQFKRRQNVFTLNLL